MKPAAVLAAARPHGERVKYMGGCRCALCRKANTRYESERARARKSGDWNGIVDASKARAHLLKLSKAGVGRRAVELATDLCQSMVHAISMGTKTRIRARTERKILAVDLTAKRLGCLIPAKRTWRKLDELIEEGYTKSFLALRLGAKTPALQVSTGFVTVRTAQRVDRLHRDLTT